MFSARQRLFRCRVFYGPMHQPDAYNACLEDLYGLRRFGIKLELDTIRTILEGLGSPQNRFSTIHVAGTNGKGSIASALATILHLAGYRVGLYTSPHLVRFNERFCIDNLPIPDDALVGAYQAVKQVAHGRREPTFFEFATAMAFYEFARQAVDWAVVETGMGGRLDATNCIQPRVSIISNISLEHRMYLGNRLTDIAAEKAGIIKEKTPVVTGVRQKSVIDVLRRVAADKSAPLFRLGEHFRTRRKPDGTFTYYGRHHTWTMMRTGLQGDYQIDNAALVLAACELLHQTGVELPLPSIREGLVQNRWPGRLEIVCRQPLVILDGAHNQAAARNLARYLAETLAGRRITLVVGILDDKPYRAMLRHLLPHCRRAVITRPNIDRGLDPLKLMAFAESMLDDLEIVPDVERAVLQAIDRASPEEVICVAGSLYVVGEAKQALEKRGMPGGRTHPAGTPAGSSSG